MHAAAVLAVGLVMLSGLGAHRSTSAKRTFQHEHPCPSTGKTTGKCPGYLVDHVWPLCAAGADSPVNMQWQTYDAAHAKDQWERRLCRAQR